MATKQTYRNEKSAESPDSPSGGSVYQHNAINSDTSAMGNNPREISSLSKHIRFSQFFESSVIHEPNEKKGGLIRGTILMTNRGTRYIEHGSENPNVEIIRTEYIVTTHWGAIASRQQKKVNG